MATDQEIREAGFKYIPQQKYLQNPFELPTTPGEEPVINQGIVNTNAFAGSGGDGFSVYNADPNTITNMNPNSYALQDARYDNELSYVGSPTTGYTTDTAAMKHMGMYPEYYGLDKPPPSKISQLIGKGIGFIPGIGTLTRFADFASGMLPVNKRAIMENQLGTQGIMVDNIGRIVVGPGGKYNTPEGIMAGYNVSKMTDKTFTGRQKDIRNTLEGYGLSTKQIDGLIAGSLTDEEMEEVNTKAINKVTGKPSDNITKIRAIEIARKNFGKERDTTDKITDMRTNNQGGEYTGTPGGNTGSGNFANIDNSGKNYGPYSNNNSGNQNVGGGASDISDRNRGGYATDDTASFFYKGGLVSIL